MTRRNPLPPDLSGRAFTVREARGAGVAWDRLSASDLAAPARGARVPVGGSALDAISSLLTSGQAFTGPTAAQIWGMPLPRLWQDDARLWVSSLSRDHTMRRPGVVGSRRSSGAPVVVDGHPVLDAVSVWRSLAPLLARHDLVAVADRIVTSNRRHPAWATPDELAAGAAMTGRGCRALRQAIGEVRTGAWSRTESLLRIAVIRAGLPEPLLNTEFPVGRGRVVVPDLAWPGFRVSAEYDGHWHDDPVRRAADLERHELMADAGWLVTHLRAPDLFPDPMAAVARILRRLHERGYRHPGPIESSLVRGSARWNP